MVSYLRLTKALVCSFAVAVALVACGAGPSSPAAPPPVIEKPTAYTVVLICDDCAAIGVKINVWSNAGTSRGSVAFSVPHNTTVSVADSKIADDGRRWFRVEYKSSYGWIPQDFVRQ